jgi:anti-sigma factor ChrR (cupin superfamily)
MPENLDETAAAYVLGTARGQARMAIEARLASEPALQAKVKLWQENFAALDLAAPQEHPPADLLDRVFASIDAAEEELPGTLTRRAGTGTWTEWLPGVTVMVLLDDPITRRRSMLVRCLPGAAREPHVHEAGPEETLVLEGDLVIGELKLSAGDYHVAPKGSWHPRATTVSGCLLYFSTPL